MSLSLKKYAAIGSLLLCGALVRAQTINTNAGTGTSGYSGDGGPATAAQIYMPRAAASDGAGNVYVADFGNNCIRKVSATGMITTFAGTGIAGFSGDGGAATAAKLYGPNGVAIDLSGNVYISDYFNNRIRKVNTSGIITTIVGTGTAGYGGTGGPATAALINMPAGIAVDAYTNVFIADYGNSRVRKVNSSGVMSDIAGNGIFGFTGDGGPATAAMLNGPRGVAVDGYGFVYIADYNNVRVRQIDLSGAIHTYAGTGASGFGGDGGPATSAIMRSPTGVAVDVDNYVYIADSANNRVRKVNATGIITTFAGNGSSTYSGDGGPATAAGMTVSNVGADPYYRIIYIPSGFPGERVRRIDTVVIAPITGPTSVCVGGNITLADATSGGIWSSAAPSIATVGSLTGVVSGISAGTVTIFYSVSGSATSTLITVNPIPAVSASATLSCGGAYAMTASGAGTYTWSPTSGLSCSTCSTTTIDPTATTVFTVTGTSSFGCVGSGTVTVNGNRISGYITPAVAGSIRVWLIHFNWFDSSIITTDSVMTCLSGGTPYYEFTSPAAGNYRVKAYLLGGTPGASGYIPTYSLSTPYWYASDTIPHGTGTDTMHVNMIYGTVPSGPGFISGYVVSGAGKGTSGEVPAVGMLVYLRDGSGNVLTYTHTDGTGAYSFSSLAYGTYGIYPEAYKYYTTPSAAITLNSTTPSVTSVGFKQHTTFGTITPFVVATIPSKGITGDLSVFPNPATNELTVSGITGNSQYRIMTITGATMAKGVLVTGTNTISTLNFATGMYILEIQNEQGEKSNIRVVKD